MVTLPVTGQSAWDVPLNAALVDLQNQVNERPLDLDWSPTDQGYAAWTYDPALSAGSTLVPTGTLNLMRIAVRAPKTLTDMTICSTVAGSGLTAGQNFVGLYDASGNRLALSADQSASWASTGVKIIPFTAPAVVPAGFFYLAILVNGTTAPQIQRGQTNAANAVNAALSTANSRYASSGAGLTALPATFTPGAVTQQPIAWWGAVK